MWNVSSAITQYNVCRSRRHAQVLRVSAGVLARLRHGGGGYGRILCYSHLLPDNPEQRTPLQDAGRARCRPFLQIGVAAPVRWRHRRRKTATMCPAVTEHRVPERIYDIHFLSNASA